MPSAALTTDYRRRRAVRPDVLDTPRSPSVEGGRRCPSVYRRRLPTDKPAGNSEIKFQGARRGAKVDGGTRSRRPPRGGRRAGPPPAFNPPRRAACGVRPAPRSEPSGRHGRPPGPRPRAGKSVPTKFSENNDPVNLGCRNKGTVPRRAWTAPPDRGAEGVVRTTPAGPTARCKPVVRSRTFRENRMARFGDYRLPLSSSAAGRQGRRRIAVSTACAAVAVAAGWGVPTPVAVGSLNTLQFDPPPPGGISVGNVSGLWNTTTDRLDGERGRRRVAERRGHRRGDRLLARRRVRHRDARGEHPRRGADVQRASPSGPRPTRLTPTGSRTTPRRRPPTGSTSGAPA